MAKSDGSVSVANPNREVSIAYRSSRLYNGGELRKMPSSDATFAPKLSGLTNPSRPALLLIQSIYCTVCRMVRMLVASSLFFFTRVLVALYV